MKKFAAFISLFLSLTIIFNSVSAVALSTDGNKKANALTVDTIHGIIAGETLRINVFSDGTPLDNYTLTSSNPEVISCSPGGYITGKKAGSSADITYTSKDGSRKTFTVYCIREIYPRKTCSTSYAISEILSAPKNNTLLSVHVNFSYIISIFKLLIGIAFSLSSSYSLNKITFFSTGKFEVCGQYGNYAYIRFDGNPTSDGFIEYTSLNTEFEQFLYISDYEHTIKSQNDTVYLTADYSGNVNWKVEDDDADGKIDYENSIIKFDPKTGKITPKKGGTTSIRASANGMWQTCEIISIYEWPQEWKVKAQQGIKLYSKPGVANPNDEIYEGDTFWVVGDLGGSNSWCYVNHGSQSYPEYSYAKIEDFSTKGTISQYNEMSFRWPVNDINIKKISSPFGPRSSKNGGNHKGFDIVSDVSGEVEGKPVVASYNGTITRIYVDNNKETSHGNAIVITTDKIDPISGKNLTVIYMHLSRWNTNSSGNIVVNGKVLKEGGSVTKEQIIGYAGNTGYNTSGAHLHYEVNNQNAAIRSGSNNPFTETINPIYFYMSMDNSITKSNTCEAASNGNGFYWYGENE